MLDSPDYLCDRLKLLPTRQLYITLLLLITPLPLIESDHCRGTRDSIINGNDEAEVQSCATDGWTNNIRKERQLRVFMLQFRCLFLFWVLKAKRTDDRVAETRPNQATRQCQTKIPHTHHHHHQQQQSADIVLQADKTVSLRGPNKTNDRRRNVATSDLHQGHQRGYPPQTMSAIYRPTAPTDTDGGTAGES